MRQSALTRRIQWRKAQVDAARQERNVQAMDDTKPSVMVHPRSNRRGWLRDLRRSAWGVAVAVLLFYVAWTLAYLGSGHDVRELIMVGRCIAALSHARGGMHPSSGFDNI